MATEQELERLIVRLAMDNAEYLRSLKDVVSSTQQAAASVQQAAGKIEGFKAEVEVSQASAPESSKSTSTTTLSQEEIDALPDDPEELAEALSAMAGPGGATFFMNGFSGGRLPACAPRAWRHVAVPWLRVEESYSA